MADALDPGLTGASHRARASGRRGPVRRTVWEVQRQAHGATSARASATRAEWASRGAGPVSDGSNGLGEALVLRTAVLDRMLEAPEPVLAVTAPPGYGKTTLLAAWAGRRGSPVAWVSCDQVDDDPEALWSAVWSALRPGEPLTDTPAESGTDPEDGGTVVHQLRSMYAGTGQSVGVVLDQVEALSSRESRRSLAEFARSVPAGWTLALASREQLPIPVARLRVERRLFELGPADLAMSRAEATDLLARTGVELSRARTSELFWLTGGWPAALYLAGLAVRNGEVTTERPFSGTDPMMRDYLTSEVLDGLSRRERKLLVRTSILDRVTGGLADAVVGGTSATRLLDRLRARNLLIVSAEAEEDGWYRCHPLLRQALQAELRAENDARTAGLHARAATWYEAHGDLPRAIDHAYLGGDAKGFGRLVLEAMHQVWASGQIDTVLHWMEQLGSRSPAPHTPAMIAHGSLIFALLGRPGDAERWAAVAESLPSAGVLPDGDTVEGIMAYLRANLCRQGPAAMRADAEAALGGLGPASSYRATMVYTVGLSELLDGDLDRAEASFAHACDLAAGIETSPLTALVLAEQAQVAIERGDWATAEPFIAHALELVTRGPFDDYWTSALVFATAARTAAHRGDLAEARERARCAARLRPLLTYALPVVSLQALLELARAYLSLIDPEGARATLEQARGILQQRPDLGTLAEAARALDERVGQIVEATPVAASALTAAELRLVPLLPTHLTYPEIGERLFISRHTVKTHAGSVYRKLGASSRAEAVERIKELGLA